MWKHLNYIHFLPLQRSAHFHLLNWDSLKSFDSNSYAGIIRTQSRDTNSTKNIDLCEGYLSAVQLLCEKRWAAWGKPINYNRVIICLEGSQVLGLEKQPGLECRCSATCGQFYCRTNWIVHDRQWSSSLFSSQWTNDVVAGPVDLKVHFCF